MVRYVSSIRFIKSVMYYKGTIVDDWLISFWWIVCVLNIIMKAFLQQLFPPEGTSSWRDHNLMHIAYRGQTTTIEFSVYDWNVIYHNEYSLELINVSKFILYWRCVHKQFCALIVSMRKKKKKMRKKIKKKYWNRKS